MCGCVGRLALLTAGDAQRPLRNWSDSLQRRAAPSAVRAFKKLPPEVQKRVRRALEKLAGDAARQGRVRGKTVTTIHSVSDSCHRLRVGDYRVMYDVIEEVQVILVLGVVHRGDRERWIRNR